jgi:hypothetical protein
VTRPVAVVAPSDVRRLALRQLHRVEFNDAVHAVLGDVVAESPDVPQE